jgi:hypothetical protein
MPAVGPVGALASAAMKGGLAEGWGRTTAAVPARGANSCGSTHGVFTGGGSGLSDIHGVEAGGWRRHHVDADRVERAKTGL